MKKAPHQTRSELHVLDRMMYLLEENSVSHLAASDSSFQEFIGQLYETLDGRSRQLRSS